MTGAHDVTRRGSSTPNGANNFALEDRFEVLKDIGDGSFGSVVLARVRGAGSNIARRGTVVSICLFVPILKSVLIPYPDCHQNDEEKLRIVCALSGASRSCIPSITSASSTSRSSSGYLSRPFQQEAPYMYGVHGWKLVPTHESAGS
jgi:hypothetical protein